MLGCITPAIFLGRAQRLLFAQGVPLLAYHKIGEPAPASLDPFLYTRPRQFLDQLTALRRLGYSPASPAGPLPAKDNPERQVVITFDDGYRSVFENARATLHDQGFSAIQFLVAGYLGRTNEWDVAKGEVPEALMDIAQVRDWLAAGHHIGSHSLTHPNLRHLSPSRAREEIQASKKALEDCFGVAIQHFSYPYGSWNESVRDLVKEAGYHTACTMAFGVNLAGTPRFELRRIQPLSDRELLAKIGHRLSRKLTKMPIRRR
jgi:peptidoglycan/xylan/chitin deacetylase (PgdA/CDA1 family)